MIPSSSPAAVLRFSPRLRVVSDNRRLSDPRAAQPYSALDALLLAGTIDERQHAAALAYARLRRRYDRRGRLTDAAYQALKARHSALIRAAGAERFPLDRLCLDDDAPMACEVERVAAALERVAGLVG